ncbi:hypothetical protein P9202_1247 [Prochlorococcus marinus str. MIT 9202]|nr:hypothetical protein P9202_1247 [Prochlorococcus marinus str. MIT 9202]
MIVRLANLTIKKFKFFYQTRFFDTNLSRSKNGFYYILYN